MIEGPRGAAAILGLHPNTLRSRLKKLGVSRRPTTVRSSHDLSWDSPVIPPPPYPFDQTNRENSFRCRHGTSGVDIALERATGTAIAYGAPRCFRRPVMLIVTRSDKSDCDVTLKLEGKLLEPWIVVSPISVPRVAGHIRPSLPRPW